jgi:amino acid transporter, AAT family
MTTDAGLRPALGGGQMSLIAMGGAIGTGLFLGSGFAVGLAGPSVLVSYAIGALIALLLMASLAEMVVAQPRVGNFGAFASLYVGPMAGVLVSYAYLSANLLAIGTEATAVALAMQVWMPSIAPWMWVAASAVLIIAVNLVTVRAFGAIESGFALIKIAAILLFLALGAWFVLMAPASSGVGLRNLTADGGFFPHGIAGTWMAVVVALFSYMSVELIAVTAAEAIDPRAAIVQALRLTSVRLTLFYLLTLGVILAVMPWREIGSRVSPFVVVLEGAHLPAAAGLLNFVVLVAALSAMNSQLYGASRTVFGLAKAGHAPQILGATNRAGVPVPALGLAASGMAVAIAVNVFWPDQALAMMIALSVFGALFTWLMIFVSHIGFRRATDAATLRFRAPGAPWTSYLGAALVAAILLTTLAMPAFRLTLLCGVPFLGLIALIFALRRRTGDQVPESPAAAIRGEHIPV